VPATRRRRDAARGDGGDGRAVSASCARWLAACRGGWVRAWQNCAAMLRPACASERRVLARSL
jgi:hypothetical protein